MDHRFFDKPNTNCDWKLLEDLRKDKAYADDLNKRIKAAITMICNNPDDRYPTGDVAWVELEAIFTLIKPLISYRPVYEDFVYAGLLEAYEDNVMFIEVRTSFPELYELDGTKLTRLDQIQIYKNVVKR